MTVKVYQNKGIFIGKKIEGKKEPVLLSIEEERTGKA